MKEKLLDTKKFIFEARFSETKIYITGVHHTPS